MTATTPTQHGSNVHDDHDERRLRISPRVAAIRRAHHPLPEDAIFLAEGIDTMLETCRATASPGDDLAVREVLARLEQTVVDAMLPRSL